MALATQADVEAILNRPLTTPEATAAPSLLDEASDLVLGYLRCAELATPTPGPIIRVVAAMVAAVLRQPAAASSDPAYNAASLGTGPFTIGFVEGSTSGSPWLTAALKLRLRPYRCGAMVSVELGSDRYA
jgi:hypothetical protein